MANSSKDRILDAAERVVVRDGALHLTLDAVAAETAMSKGGLLYHFPTKDELIRAMIVRLTESYIQEVARLESEDPVPAGRKLRAMIRASFPEEPTEACIRTDRVAGALLAAVANSPSLLEPMHELTRVFHEAIARDGIDPVLAMVIHMAADGMWMAQLFGNPLDPGLRRRVVDRLIEMTKGV
jgi:AcrR family transcriptional regulator